MFRGSPDAFDLIVRDLELKLPEGVCPRCFPRKLVYLNRVRVCMGCGYTEDRGTMRA